MDYPEHERVKAIQREAQAINDFVDWLHEEKELSLYAWDEATATYCPAQDSVTDLIAEFFGIDCKKLDAEKQKMLDEIRGADETT